MYKISNYSLPGYTITAIRLIIFIYVVTVPVNYAKVTFTLLIFIVGIVANGAAIFVVVILKEYKKSITHW